MRDIAKIKKYLEERLQRKASKDELANATYDANILIDVIFEEIDNIKKKIGMQ